MFMARSLDSVRLSIFVPAKAESCSRTTTALYWMLYAYAVIGFVCSGLCLDSILRIFNLDVGHVAILMSVAPA